jgi:hypothetical protein
VVHAVSYRRTKNQLKPSVDRVALVKEGPPKPKDVKKAAANFDHITATYHQCYRALALTNSEMKVKNDRSYKMIMPYLKEFGERNPGSTALAEKDDGNNLQRFFVCPGLMQESLRFVRPVMSLDAAHMKSCLGGTLYIATVKTACDEIFPVAFAITHQNEDLEGWIWFLRNLRQALPVLTFDHPRYGVQYKYFTFISDRQKGLIPALQLVFPDNHSFFCDGNNQFSSEECWGQERCRAKDCWDSKKKVGKLCWVPSVRIRRKWVRFFGCSPCQKRNGR